MFKNVLKMHEKLTKSPLNSILLMKILHVLVKLNINFLMLKLQPK